MATVSRCSGDAAWQSSVWPHLLQQPSSSASNSRQPQYSSLHQRLVQLPPAVMP